MIAICYYTAKNYTEALKYFMRAYDLLENDKIKNVVAYNIGNLYALQGDMDNAIKWLIIPLDQDRKLFLEKIRSDKDFDSIRGNQKFKEFLAEQERLLTK